MDSLQIGWFSSGGGAASRNLLMAVQEKIAQGEINGHICFVFCNREPGESEKSDRFIDLVSKYRLLLDCFSSRKFQSSDGHAPYSDPWRLEYDKEVMKRLEEPLAELRPDICILAGYMLIVGSEMCQEYPMINLHPAAPGGPRGTWQNVIRQLIENEATRSGIMMHLVTPELDRGPIAAHCTFSIKDDINEVLWRKAEDGDRKAKDSLFWDIRQRGLIREAHLIIATLKAFSQGKIRIADRRIVDAEGRLIPGYNFTPTIDDLIG